MKKNLLQKYIEGNVTPEEIETVVDWLDQDESHIHEYMALHKLYDISILNGTVRNSKQRKVSKRFSLHKILYEATKIAAVVLLVLGIKYVLNPLPGSVMHSDKTAYQTLFVPAGQRAELTLPDNTVVWLNAKTTIVYPTHFETGNRMIELDGEAYFNVTSNKEQPFIVKTRDMNIRVLGTEFNVLAYASSPFTEVSLLEGSVELRSSVFQSDYIMNEKEKIRMVDRKLFSSRIDDYDYFKWKEGLICFNNETVESMIRKLELYYDVQIEIKNPSLLKYRYTGKFRTKDGIEQILKVLQLEHRFTYVKNNDLNLITIK
ncbi:MAG: FecR family protein [Tannerellaceae bacterium]|nr:FecR family protein [Tannerellaceae bacterium]